jgi:DNA-binding NarL/FixJ family response regulator
MLKWAAAAGKRTMMTEPALTRNERRLLAALLAGILALVLADLISDRGEGVSAAHLALEGAAGLAAMAGLAALARDRFRSKRALANARADAHRWKIENQRHLAGLGQAIDDQLVGWGLSHAEREVAWLLIKGLSLREIASARGTTEKTARAQAVVVYGKSQTRNRSELAAFFLEDLFAGKA